MGGYVKKFYLIDKKLISLGFNRFFMIVIGIICFLLLWIYEAIFVAPRNIWGRHWSEWKAAW